ELGVTGDEMGWPCNTHVDPLTVKVNLGMEKSVTIVPNDPNQASPRITSAPATGRTKRGTLKGSGGRGFGVGSKAVVAGVEFGFAMRAGVTGFGSGLGVENGERGDVGWWMAISFWISARRPEMKQFSPKRSWSARENSSQVPSKWFCARCLYQLSASPGEIFLVVVAGYVVVVAVVVGVGLGGGVSGGYQILCLRRLFGFVNLLVDRRLMCLYGEAW
nr:hypothetical protein [Tanacetum cinerariifolium]